MRFSTNVSLIPETTGDIKICLFTVYWIDFMIFDAKLVIGLFFLSVLIFCVLFFSV